MSFPKDFVWGAAAASYQIEGAAYEDGKGLSIWDMWCRQPGTIYSENTGDVACDHYHRYEEDTKIMSEIGLKAYRLSISWPRVIPGGTGQVNNKGLAFYDRLIDSLLEKNIEPWVTLFHWDYPYDLFCKGGWLNRASSDWFADYVLVVIDKLSDRVSHWIPQNEPQCFINFGHLTGYHAPGLNLGIREVLLAAHNSLLAHGKSVQVIRSQAKSTPKIGCATVGVIDVPASISKPDIEAAKNSMFSVKKKDLFINSWFSDPMILGYYPEDGIKLFQSSMPEIKEKDMETINQPLDFYGVNIYTAQVVKADSQGNPIPSEIKEGPPLTTMKWHIIPESLYWGPKFFYERYKLPIVITENGMANTDWIHLDGKVHDLQRIDFLNRYLIEYLRASDDGIKIEGYFLWSILDNFEWPDGFSQRFGIVYVDYSTGKRTLKDSAYWYKDIIESNGEHLFK